MVRPGTFLPPPINFGDSLKIVILGLMGFLTFAAVTHLKPWRLTILYMVLFVLMMWDVYNYWWCSLFRMCVCYDAYCYICLNFQVHIQQWIDFASFEIVANILAFYRPAIGRAVFRPPVSYILFYYGIVLILFWHLNDDQA